MKSNSSITIPSDFKSTMPPRKRAKTKEEKEQRRIERILRNRKAAHLSREKKRLHVQYLETRCNIMEKLLDQFPDLDQTFQNNLYAQNLLYEYRSLNEADFVPSVESLNTTQIQQPTTAQELDDDYSVDDNIQIKQEEPSNQDIQTPTTNSTPLTPATLKSSKDKSLNFTPTTLQRPILQSQKIEQHIPQNLPQIHSQAHPPPPPPLPLHSSSNDPLDSMDPLENISIPIGFQHQHQQSIIKLENQEQDGRIHNSIQSINHTKHLSMMIHLNSNQSLPDLTFNPSSMYDNEIINHTNSRGTPTPTISPTNSTFSNNNNNVVYYQQCNQIINDQQHLYLSSNTDSPTLKEISDLYDPSAPRLWSLQMSDNNNTNVSESSQLMNQVPPSSIPPSTNGDYNNINSISDSSNISSPSSILSKAFLKPNSTNETASKFVKQQNPWVLTDDIDMALTSNNVYFDDWRNSNSKVTAS
ncbi:hypothetical protein TBLA_0G03420 [Henningerozyma blattae CBS 6284]|uniref:Uncharacterized protein n=1 Tax=Henningerozyma blattae (strain ATCC 34711 / CBS 6284 / DSM 70876 / NBRC 10599 / NRRL Y-10934 / UCD 77-7) TaxID=1071380 RepID=I2H7C7_HENB6|nr:hypothetical protein TBLA_0G03420 [Tetrapisispora blattae CBS 6284]CCH62279.1 hypothetical protein TBLA_0G03420 [Tetrapisispora blattae CBS 6284]